MCARSKKNKNKKKLQNFREGLSREGSVGLRLAGWAGVAKTR